MTTKPLARTRSTRLGLPLLALLGLAVLASLRGVLHDLHLVESGSPLTLVFVIVPLIVWVAVAVVWSSRPFVSLLVAGLLHGLLLGATHLLLWDANLAGAGIDQPALGGALAGVLPPLLEAVLLRVAAFVSSVIVGAVLGSVAGLLAWALRRLPVFAPLPRTEQR